MPYVSPRGNIKTAAPPRRKSTAPLFKEAEGDYEQGLAHMASKELGEVIEGRDEDPEVEAVMENLNHWTGWASTQPHKHHLDGTRVFEDDEASSLDPIEDVDEALARIGMEDGGESGKDLALGEAHEVRSTADAPDKTSPLAPAADVEMEDVQQEPKSGSEDVHETPEVTPVVAQ